jgi:hypothetical protein
MRRHSGAGARDDPGLHPGLLSRDRLVSVTAPDGRDVLFIVNLELVFETV